MKHGSLIAIHGMACSLQDAWYGGGSEAGSFRDEAAKERRKRRKRSLENLPKEVGR